MGWNTATVAKLDITVEMGPFIALAHKSKRVDAAYPWPLPFNPEDDHGSSQTD